MSKYDVLIREYLLTNNIVSLEKIGAIKLDATAALPESAVNRQHGNFIFQYDKKAVTTPELINFIAERTGKKRSLIDSDITSYFEQIRQFLHIGKPYEIEGVGLFRLNKAGEYEFFLAELRPPQHAVSNTGSKNVTAERTVKKQTRSSLTTLAAILMLLVLGGLSWWGYQYFTTGKSASWDDKLYADSTKITTFKNDTASANRASVDHVLDSITINYIIDSALSLEQLNKQVAAYKSYAKQVMHDNAVFNGIKKYRLFIQQTTLPADTTKVKNSLQKNLKKNIRIEVSNQ